MNKLRLNLLLLLISILGKTQKIDNQLYGLFVATSDTAMYSTFEFDGNGKVSIAGFSKEDFFTKDDTVFVFTDKMDMFLFKKEVNGLRGLSNHWVEYGRWNYKDTNVVNNRTNADLAQKKAILLHQYYVKTRMNMNQIELLFDESAMKNYKNDLTELCDKGLAKACMELFGIRTMEQMGGMSAIMNRDTSIKLHEDSSMIALANRIISLGEIEGYTVLANYYLALGQKEKSNAVLDQAIELGSAKAALVKFNLEMLELEQKNSEEKPIEKLKKSIIKKQKKK